MKKLTKIILIIFLFTGCKSNLGVNETELSVLIDGTDSTIKKPKFADFEPYLALGRNDDGVKFKAQLIGDIDFGSSFEITIPPKGNDDQTDEERYVSKSKFIKDSKTGYELISSIANHKDYSIIYRVVATELNRLAKSTANEKILIISSDLLERSDFYNIYNAQDRQLLLKSPELIKEKFLKQVQLDSLNGVNVVFTYQPTDFEQNKIYTAIQRIYAELIIKNGGRCKIGAI